MSKRCVICNEDNITTDHEQSKKHLKNAGLFELHKNKKKFSENSNGIVVKCTVTPTAYNAMPLLAGREQAKLEVNVKPHTGVRFKFTIKNDNRHQIIFGGMAMIQKNRNIHFTLENKNVGVGTSAHIIPPNQTFKQQISFTFESQNIGIYQLPIFFMFPGAVNEQDTVIYKEMVVCVAKDKKQNENVDSPYTKEVIFAEKIISSPAAARRIEKNKYCIPSKDYWKIFEFYPTDKNGGQGKLNDVQDALATVIRNDIFPTGPTPNNYVKYFRHLLWCEEVAVANNLKNYNMTRVSLLPHGQKGKLYALLVPGLAEKRPSIVPGDFVHVRPHGQTAVLFESLITDIEDTYAVFGAFGAEFKRYFVPGAKFDVRFFMSRVPLERMHEAVSIMQIAGATSKTYPRKTTPPKILTIPKEKYFNKKLADIPEQRSAIEHVVSGSSGAAPYLLLGPPGSGKTATIVEAILQLARDPEVRILVCADSNSAADTVASELVRYRKHFLDDQFLLRANSEFRTWSTMPKNLAHFSNGTKRENCSRVTIKRFLNHRIVITTLIHAAKYARELKDKKYERVTTHLFIDEAAHASEPAALVPAVGLLAPAGALVLAGDPQQLGPVCISREARDRGLGVSLMERLKKNYSMYSDENLDPNYGMMLKTIFRCHADILSIPNELFYNGELKSAAKEDRISTMDILHCIETSRAIVFHGAQSKEQRDGKSPSFYNDIEAELVQDYADALVNVHKIPQRDIGVVTPYTKQVARIKEWLDALGLAGVEVGTVESFQGKEKRVIIVSCVRANCDLFAHDAKFRLGFVDCPQRFNVALTRAKAKLVVIGNPLCLQRDPKWLLYMQRCRQLGTYAGFECGLETDSDRDAVLDDIKPVMEAMVKAVRNCQI